jgi:hypothetical protein
MEYEPVRVFSSKIINGVISNWARRDGSQFLVEGIFGDGLEVVEFGR